MSRKGKPNKKGRIEYPRKCEHCDYVSNNPSMYHYHKKTHEPIPEGQLCDHGCRQPAKYLGTGGIYSCSEISQHCPEYIQRHSKRIKKQWNRPESTQRKKETKKRFLEHCAGNEDAIQKMKETKRRKYNTLTPEELSEYKVYARKARAGAQRWAKENGYDIGKQTYHVDHKLSVKDAFRANLPLGVLNHPANLQVLPANENVSKGANSQITVKELLENINTLL